MRDRAAGTLLGLAVGDALGAPFEFMRSVDVPNPLPAFEKGSLGSGPGMWTDDTAMALNLTRSLVASGGRLDLDDLMQRHVEWLESGPDDIGNLTYHVLSWASQGALAPARDYFEKKGPEFSAGNGSVMYCAPLGVAKATRPEELLEEAPALSALTHWDGRCRTACLAVTLAVAALVRGESGMTAVKNAVGSVVDLDLEGAEELEYLVDEAGNSRPIDGADQGFTLFTAGVGLRVAAHEMGFEEGTRYVVSLGGDTDTNGAVAGALLGALHGSAGIPPKWLEKLYSLDEIRQLADALALLA